MRDPEQCQDEGDQSHHLALQHHAIERGKRQSKEQLDAAFEHPECITKGEHAVSLGAVRRGGIRDTPMRRHRMTRPHGANLASSLVADRKHKIHCRCAWRGIFIPRLRAQARRRKPLLAQQPQRERMHLALGKAARAKPVEDALPQLAKRTLGEDAPRRVARAEEQHVVGPATHPQQLGGQQIGPPGLRASMMAEAT
jgi:hypothetical protein